LAVKPFFWGGMLKDTKRQLTRNELVALNFIILGISLISESSTFLFSAVSRYP
jgi:hypothetical protein